MGLWMHLLPTTAVILLIDTRRGNFKQATKAAKVVNGIWKEFCVTQIDETINSFSGFPWRLDGNKLWLTYGGVEHENKKPPLSCYHHNHQILHVAIKLWKNLPNEKEDGGDLKIENKEGFIGKCPNTQCHLSLTSFVHSGWYSMRTCSVSMEQLNSTRLLKNFVELTRNFKPKNYLMKRTSKRISHIMKWDYLNWRKYLSVRKYSTIEFFNWCLKCPRNCHV